MKEFIYDVKDLMHSLCEKLRKKLALTLLVLIVFLSVMVFLGIGLITDPRSFFSNLLAECAGNGIAILLGIFLIDKLLKYHRDQQLVEARHYTLKAIAVHLCDIASRVPEYFPVQDPSSIARILRGRNEFHSAAVKGFEDLLAQLCEHPPNNLSDRARDFYEAVKGGLDQIQTVLTPRVMQISENQKLINELMEFNNVRRELHDSIFGYSLIRTGSIHKNVCSLVEHSGQLYQALS